MRQCNHTAGGINMNFFPMGALMRRTGIFFIRRSFKDNEVYKLVLRQYIDYLVEKRFPLEWYIEGTRSRSGKLMPPRFGLLAYVVDASGARLYVDGVSRSSLGWSGSPGAPSTTQPLQIGRYPNAPPPAFFPGVVDDVRIYGRALSAAEALELYTNFGAVSDTTPPVISAIAVLGATASSATVSWTTNEPSDTQVDYGPTPAYGSTTSLQAGLATAHVQTLSGLAANTLYYARVRSRDFAGNLAVSSSTTFRTAADPAAASVQHAAKKKKKKSWFDDIFGFLGF